MLTLHGAQFGFAGATADSVCAAPPVHTPGAEQTTLTCALRGGVAGSSTAAVVTSFYGVSHPFVVSYGPAHCFNGAVDGGETGLDCGGPCALPCNAAAAIPVLESLSLTRVPGANGGCTAADATVAASGIDIVDCPGTGGVVVTLNGRNFGGADQADASMLCSSDLVLVSPTMMTCLIRASSLPRTVFVSVATQAGRSQPRGLTYAPLPRCDDGVQNGDETGIDCGGASCAVCSPFAPVVFSITASAVCVPAVADGTSSMSTSSPSSLDLCPPTARGDFQSRITLTISGANFGESGAALAAVSSGLCEAGSLQHSSTAPQTRLTCTLAAATAGTVITVRIVTFAGVSPQLVTVRYMAGPCNDGVMNGAETGVDCGGSCAPCSAACISIANAGIAEANQPYVLVTDPLPQFGAHYTGTVTAGFELVYFIPDGSSSGFDDDNRWQLWYAGQPVYAAISGGDDGGGGVAAAGLTGQWVTRGGGVFPPPRIATGCDATLTQPSLASISATGCVEPTVRTGVLYCPFDAITVTTRVVENLDPLDGSVSTTVLNVQSNIVLTFTGAQFGLSGAFIDGDVCITNSITHKVDSESSVLNCVLKPSSSPSASSPSDNSVVGVRVGVMAASPDGVTRAYSTQQLSVVYVPKGCFNGVRDGIESGVDCGGVCVPCTCKAPSAPVVTKTVPGYESVGVYFDPPADTGGSPIDYYYVRTSPAPTGSQGRAITYGTFSPITVSYLTPGVAYTFAVTATNSGDARGGGALATGGTTVLGTPCGVTGNESAPSLPMVSDELLPGVVTSLRATTAYDETTISVSWAAPTTQTATAAVTHFTVNQYTHVVSFGSDERRITLSDTRTAAATQPSLDFDSVASGGVYSYVVLAHNAYGTGAPSPHSNLVVPGGSLPGVPFIGSATAGDTIAYVTYTAPAVTGVSEILFYTATAAPGGATATAESGPIVVTGLTNGVEYTFTVVATNAAGTGAASQPSNAVTPGNAPPSAPRARKGVADSHSVTLFFDPPAKSGGAPVTLYTVTATATPSPTAATAMPVIYSQTGVASPITVSGVAVDVAYRISVTVGAVVLLYYHVVHASCLLPP